MTSFAPFDHAAEIFNRHGIGDAVPDGGLVALEISEAVGGGFGFEKIVHLLIPSEARDPFQRTEISGPRSVRDNSILAQGV